MTESAMLDEVYEEFEDSLAPDTEVERFVPTTDAHFEWAMRKRARAIAKAAELRSHKEHELMLLGSAFDRRIAEHTATEAFFTDMIERGIAALEPDSKGKRTVKTVVGTAYVRHTERFVWPDDDALVAWAKQNAPDAVRVKETADKTLLKAYVKETGAFPDGLTVEPTDTIVIKEA